MQSEDLYARLELLTSEHSPEPIQASQETPADLSAAVPRARWQRWGQALLNYFVGSLEPRITTQHDRQGAIYYEVYDPVDRRRHTFNSEADVRVWLEGRYYQ